MATQLLDPQKYKRQNGLTMISWIFVIGVIGFLGVMAVNIAPNFLTDSSVATVMKALETDQEARKMNGKALKRLIIKRLKINNIYDIKHDQIKISKDRRGRKVTIEYQPRGTLIGKVDYIISFKHEAIIPK